MSTKPNTAYTIMPNQAYTLQTTLKPNKIYSCFGIKIRVKEEVDIFSNEGNNNGKFEIRISGINWKDLETQSKGINLKEKRKQRQDHKRHTYFLLQSTLTRTKHILLQSTSKKQIKIRR